MNYFIFDDVFDFDYRTTFYTACTKARYNLGWYDRADPQSKMYNYLHSELPLQALEESEFFLKIKNQRLKNFLSDKKPKHQVVNLSHPSNVFFTHTHPDHISLIYYINLEWQSHWHGETVVYKQNGIDIETCVSFVPNRVLILEKGVPHALRPPSVACPDYRYTFACFLQPY